MKSIWKFVLVVVVVWCGALGVFRITSRPSPVPPGQGDGPPLANHLPVRPEAGVEEADGQPVLRALAAARRGPAAEVEERLLAEDGSSSPDEAMADLLSARADLADPEVRQELVEKLRRLEQAKAQQTREEAARGGYPLVTEDGAILVGFDAGQPRYEIDDNANAAITTGADLVRNTAPFHADGAGFSIGLWESGNVPTITHREFAGRIAWEDGETVSDFHANHVAGTLIASGAFHAGAKGMAPAAAIRAHNTVDALSEMTALAAAAPGQANTIYLSNHSYSFEAGWNASKTAWYGTFSDDLNPSNDEVFRFGIYNSYARQWDGLAWNAPYHLVFKSAGNDRNDGPPAAGAAWKLNNSSQPANQYSYDAFSHPGGDYAWQSDGGFGGFGTIGDLACAKNIVTVGSVSDAVSGGARSASQASLSSFSAAGPTDDGRIKPDLVASGESVFSCDLGDASYSTQSGTSMSTPNACGSALLLVDYFSQVYPGQAPLASTVKALLIQGADDLGKPGPDYRYGWGLMNVKQSAEILREHATEAGVERIVEAELNAANPSHAVTAECDGGGPLRVTVCWTDPAGSSTTAHDSRVPRLVHDLNLTVTGPGGSTQYPYVMPWVGDWSDAKLDDPAVTGVNTVDNVEQVHLETPVAGTYTLRVDHAGVLAQGAQAFSLVVSGAAIVTGPPVVRVVEPVPDLRFVAHDAAPVGDVADVNTVFSGDGHAYEVSVEPEGILGAVIDGDGRVDLTPVPQQYGAVVVTLTATDSFQHVAQDSFEVTLASPVLHVDAGTPAGAGSQDGFAWSTAYRHLQDALLLAESGQQIRVAAGTYYPDRTNAADSNSELASFVVPAGVSVYGGFAAGDSELGDADPAARPTVLCGAIGSSLNSHQVVDLSACGAGDVFDGFEVTDGRADHPGRQSGGGILSVGGSATISRCVVRNNHADLDGGGICLTGGNPAVLNTIVQSNNAGLSGGGLFLGSGTVRGCTVSNNAGSSRGGGLSLQGGAVSLEDCRVIGNSTAGGGGGIHVNSPDAAISRCEVRGNVSSSSGGAGLSVEGGVVQVASCLFSGGKGFFGSGGVQAEGGSLSLTNCTITGNYSSAFGGGGVLVNGSASPVVLNNCIVWNNRAGGSTTTPQASVYHGSATAPLVLNSLVHNSSQSGAWNTIGTDRGGNSDGDPAFAVPLSPSFSGDAGGDFALLLLSPAINAGGGFSHPAEVAGVYAASNHYGLFLQDLAGAQRLMSARVDQGAYEFGNLDLLDADQDGMADSFELAHAGDVVALEASSDLDGDGLTALAEFAHGLDPTLPLTSPPGLISLTQVEGETYLTIGYDVRDSALGFVEVAVERTTDLPSPVGWSGGETVVISSQPVPGAPGFTRVVERSLVPVGTTSCEYFRLRHEAVFP